MLEDLSDSVKVCNPLTALLAGLSNVSAKLLAMRSYDFYLQSTTLQNFVPREFLKVCPILLHSQMFLSIEGVPATQKNISYWL